MDKVGNDPNREKDILIEKLFFGTCAEEELKALFQIIKEDPEPYSQEIFEKLWENVPKDPDFDSGIRDKLLKKTLTKIEVAESSGDFSRTWKKDRRIWVSMAASLLIIISLFIWNPFQRGGEMVVTTAYGEQQSLQLSDGSKVKLNANTKMVYSDDWTQKIDREVWLDGEAFFEVTKKPQSGQRFRVKTNDVTIEVLGTSFNVNSHGDKTSIYLEEGEIRLHLLELDSTILMQPGDLIIYQESEGKIINKHQVETAYHTSWKNGVLIFNSSPLIEVLQKIEETYGVHFEVKDSVDNQREINFPLPINRLETAISILNKTVVDLEIVKVGDKYIIE